MFRLITPILIIGISIAGFFVFVSPISKDVTTLKEQVSSYNQALDNAVTLEKERDKLTQKYNSIPVEDLNKLQKLLPDNVDNIRLILEIEKIAAPYGMLLKEIKYNVEEKTEASKAGISEGGTVSKPMSDNYGVWDLEFSTEGSYTNFLKLVKDLENNLRIVDISTIQFSSEPFDGNKNTNSDVYKYGFKIKTYWMKN